MALVTTCQACQTQFEVTEEQLNAFDGKVRCGECQQVFDARLQLETLEADASETVVAVMQRPPANDPLPPAAIASSLDIFEDVAIRRARHAIAEAAARLAELDEADRSATVPALQDTAATPDSMPAVAADSTAVHAPVSVPPGPDDGLLPEATPQETETALPAFLRDVSDQQTDAPLSATRRRVLILSVGILVLTLLGQWLYSGRHALAASYPHTRPWLIAGCQLLHCTIMLPKQIDHLMIDDADVQEHPEHEGVLVFSSVLSNHDHRTLAFPVIELTLTSTGDEAVFRRHLQPEDYLPAIINPSDGIAAGQTLPVKVLLTVEAAALANHAVAGFRVAIAYQ